MDANGDDEAVCRRAQLEQLMKREMESQLRFVRYDPTECGRLCRQLCASIRSKAKQLDGSKQLKTVVNVILGQDSKDQSVHLAVRAVADPAKDAMASAVFRNRSIFAIGLVHEVNSDTTGSKRTSAE